jgi:hypothetical protein
VSVRMAGRTGGSGEGGEGGGGACCCVGVIVLLHVLRVEGESDLVGDPFSRCHPSISLLPISFQVMLCPGGSDSIKLTTRYLPGG